MIQRLLLKCDSCEKKFYIRVTVGLGTFHKFRFNCPYCDLEMHGEVFLNYTNPDGSHNSITQSLPTFRFTNANRKDEETEDDVNNKCLTIFTDIPILKEYYISDNSFQLPGPSFQTIHELKNFAPIFINGINKFYSLPENDFYLIKNAYREYRKNNFEKAIKILNKISNNIPGTLSRIPSACAFLYVIYFDGLLGYWENISYHANLIEEIGKRNIENIFDVPKSIKELGVIENFINEFMDLANQIYDCKDILSVAHYFDYINLNTYPKHIINLDYPDKFFSLYEQLCEYAHKIIKIEIGYLNIKERGNIDSFSNTKFSSYKKYFKDAKLFDSLDLIKEYSEIGDDFNFSIDRSIRNGIAHKSISFSQNGQQLLIKKGKSINMVEYDLTLKKTILLSRICVTCFGIITDQNRMISDSIWEK